MVKLKRFWTSELPDPVRHCKVYKMFGCAHVDGPICDMRTCTIRVAAEITPNKAKEVDRETNN